MDYSNVRVHICSILLFEVKLHKIGQSEHTFCLNKSKDFNTTHYKYGLGYENPNHLQKAISLLPSVYDYDIFKLTEHYPNYGIQQNLKKEEFSKHEWMKFHDHKYKVQFLLQQ